jgi:hypothetical protein
MSDEQLYAIWNATPHSIDKLRMIAEFGRTLYRMGQEEMRERAAIVAKNGLPPDHYLPDEIRALEVEP